MSIIEIIAGKRAWRAHMARVRALPGDYQTVYRELQKYVMKSAPVELAGEAGLLAGIVDLFETGAASGKAVLDVTGTDIAAFCDELIKSWDTGADCRQSSLNAKMP